MRIFEKMGNSVAGYLESHKQKPVEPKNHEKQYPAQDNGHPYRSVSPEDMDYLLERSHKEIGSDFGYAETIMNRENYQGYMGVEQVKKAFDIELDSKEIPPIPFSEADLEKARELGQFLVLRVDKTTDGQSLTMQKMEEILQPKFDQQNQGKVLWRGMQWARDQKFFKKDTPRLSWALTSREVIPNSTGKNYLNQTQKLVDYLEKQVFSTERAMPTEYVEAIKEFNEQKDEITQLMQTDWKNTAKKLSELQINQLCRQTPTQAMYDTFIHFQNTDKKLLENRYSWTSRLSSAGELVAFGHAVSDGADVDYWNPVNAYGGLGVVFSRSQ